MATFAAFGGRDSGVPMLLGAAAFAALESDAYYHTLPASRPVEFAFGSRNVLGEVPQRVLRMQRALSRCSSFFHDDACRASARSIAFAGPGREVKRIAQALQFTIVVKRAGLHSMKP